MNELEVIQLAPNERVETALERYRASGLVEFAEPDYKLHATVLPNDPDFVNGNQWALRNSLSFGSDIHATEAWDTLTAASNIVVAIVDSGIRLTHEDLAENLWTNRGEIPGNGIDDDRNGVIDDVHGFNAVNNGGNPSDDAGHGTHVAGIIGAVGNNARGIAGVAWKVKLMPCKFLTSTGDGDTSDAIQCIDYARRMGAHVINASWGGPDYSSALYTAISNARAAGIIFVTAAGNESNDIDAVPIYPACFNLDNIVAVGATTRSDTFDSSYSSYGAKNVDLCAPGTSIFSTWHTWDGAYTTSSGTSMAAPHVTGALALMKARFTNSTSSEILARLLASVDVLPSLSGKCKTGGRLNLARALGQNPTASFSASRLSGEPPLAVGFTNTTLGELRSIRWDFGDGSSISTEANPVHVFARSGSFTVKLAVEGTNGRTSEFEQVVNVRLNYEVVGEPFAWIDPAGMTTIPLSDNGVSAALALPFEFLYYWEKFNSIFVGANGLLSFSNEGLSASDNTRLPAAAAPNAIICPYWDNLNPGAGGNVHVGVMGAAPNRKWVASWVDVPRNSTSTRLTFQAILEEGSNQIVFQYLEVHPEGNRGGAKRATVGIEDSTGTIGALYTFNGSPKVLENQSALRFRPRPYRYLLVRPDRLEFRIPSDGAPRTLTLENPGTRELRWSITPSENWLNIQPAEGSLGAGRSAAVEVSLAAGNAEWPPGRSTNLLTVSNLSDGNGSQVIPAVLEVSSPSLRLRPPEDNLFVGGLGGPFSPSSRTVQLENAGLQTLRWSGSSDVTWLRPLPSSGTLSSWQMAAVEVELTTEAERLPSGTHEGVVRFTDDTNRDAPLEQRFRIQVNARVGQASAAVSGGAFHGKLALPAEGGYVVEVSEDLENWRPLERPSSLANGLVSFDDPLEGASHRFYRLRME